MHRTPLNFLLFAYNFIRMQCGRRVFRSETHSRPCGILYNPALLYIISLLLYYFPALFPYNFTRVQCGRRVCRSETHSRPRGMDGGRCDQLRGVHQPSTRLPCRQLQKTRECPTSSFKN